MNQQINPDETYSIPNNSGQANLFQPGQPVQATQPAQPTGQPAPAQPSRVSRRSILRGAAGVGAVGIAAAAGAGAAVAVTRQPGQATLMPTSKPVTVAPMPPQAMAGPLVVYLADTSTGEFDVYGDTGQMRVKNPALVSQLLKNMQLAQQ